MRFPACMVRQQSRDWFLGHKSKVGVPRRPRGWLDWSISGVAGYLGYVPGAPPPAPAPDLAPPSEADIQDLYRDLDLDLRLLQGASTAPSAGSPVHIAADVQARCRRNLATDPGAVICSRPVCNRKKFLQAARALCL